MDKILVLGGTGFVGRAFCAQYVAQHGAAEPRLTVPTRRLPHGRDEMPLVTVDPIEANVHDERTLAGLVEGHTAVVNLIGILHGSEREFERAHVQLPRRLAKACLDAGVRRVVHVSALGASRDAPSHYLRSKAAGEAVLRDAELELTLLRPSVMFGAQDHFLNTFARLQRWLPVVPLACADARFQPVWVDDVGLAIVRILEQPHTIGKTFDAVGPRVYTLAELVRLAGRWSGHERPIVPLPAPLARLQALVMEALPGTPLLTRDNLESMKVASVASGGWSNLTALGIVPASLEAVVPNDLAAAATDAHYAWRAHR